MKRVIVQKSGWNTSAALLGPFWYLFRGMTPKGTVMLFITLGTIGIGLIPIWIYCGFNANKDFYRFLKEKGTYIYQ